MKNKPEPLKIAHFRFALIAPVIQGLYPDASEAAYYRRVTQDPILRPDGVSYKYSPDTLERWTGLYRKKGMDGLIPGFRKDKGVSRALSADAINEIYRLREKFPRINGVMIHQMLVQSGFIDAKVSVRAVQRFLKENDLRSARNPAVKDRKAYEMPEFGCMWQADCPQPCRQRQEGLRNAGIRMHVAGGYRLPPLHHRERPLTPDIPDHDHR